MFKTLPAKGVLEFQRQKFISCTFVAFRLSFDNSID